MRITKKFTGASCIGKRVFHPLSPTPSNENELAAAHVDLARLESAFLSKLEEQKNEAERKTKKAPELGAGRAVIMSAAAALAQDEGVLALRAQDVPGGGVALKWVAEAKRALCDASVGLSEVDRLIGQGRSISAAHDLPCPSTSGGLWDHEAEAAASPLESFERPRASQGSGGRVAMMGLQPAGSAVLPDGSILGRKRPLGFSVDPPRGVVGAVEPAAAADREAGGILVDFMQSFRKRQAS